MNGSLAVAETSGAAHQTCNCLVAQSREAYLQSDDNVLPGL